MQTFTKAERLCSKIEIDGLFEKGKSFNSKPFKIIWQASHSNISSIKIVFSVPKRLFKKAVDRNRIKRLMREVYRKNKHLLHDNLENKNINLMFIFISKTIIEYTEMEEKTVLALQHLIKNINT